MRKLIIAVLVLISLDSFAQPLNYTWYKQRIRQYSHMVDSAFYVPRYNGTPSGVRTNENAAIDGAIAIDTTNHRLYIYSGNAWKRVANYSELGVDSIWREAGTDSIFWSKAGNTYKIKDSTGGGGGSGGGIGSFEDSVANVRDFGAVGDGSTEDSTAFKNALATGRDVYVPKGVYKVSAINLSPVAGQTIFGDGENTRIITAQTDGAIFKVTNPNVKFMNLAFEGSGKTSSIPGWTTTTYQMGIWVVIQSTTITNCTFRKFNGRAVYIFHPSATYIMNNTVINNRFFQNTVGIESDYGADYLLIANNSLDSNYACLVEGGNANVYYLGNQATQSTYGYYSRGGATHGSIVGGSFNHCTTGLRIPSGQQGMTVTDTKFWYSDIVLGSSDTVSRVSFYNCVVEGSNVTLTKAKNNKWVGGYIYGSSANSITGTGLTFENVITAPDGLNETYSKITSADSSFTTKNGLNIGRGILAANLPTFADTTNYKPLVINATGTVYKATYWPGGGGGSTPTLQQVLATESNNALIQSTDISPVTEGFGLTLGAAADWGNFYVRTDSVVFPLQWNQVTGDTTNNKPVVMSNTGKITRLNYWGNASGGGSGVTTVGTFSGSSQSNGASISGSTITFGPADGTNPGMVSTGTQTFAGDKTFTGLIKAADGSSGNPSITFATSDNEGFWLNGTGNLVMANQNQNIWQTNTAAMRIRNSIQINFASGDPTSTGADIGIARDAAGVLRVTNGSTGYGNVIAKQLIVGSGNTFAASSDAAIHLYNGTVPTGSITNGVLLYAEDVTASSELKVRDEAGNITTLSPHNFGKIPGGRSEKLAWSFYSQRNGEYITADMTKALRTIENQSAEIEELKKQVAELKGLIYEIKKPVKLIYTGKVK